MEQRLKTILSTTFSIPEEAINDSLSTDSVESWTSLSHSNLILALEQAFNVSFTTMEVIEMMNYKLIRHILQQKLEETPA